MVDMVQNLRKMTVDTQNDRRCYLVLPYNINLRHSVEEAMTIAVHHSILCDHIRNCNPNPPAGCDITEIKWHDELKKLYAVEMGPS